MPFIVAEPSSGAVDDFLRSKRRFCVSDFAAAETASAFSRLVRMGKLDREGGVLALSTLDAWRAAAAINVGVTGPDIRLADAFVRRFDVKLRTPDAVHVALCRRLDDTLVTLDRRLAQAAGVLGVRTAFPA